MVYSKKKSIGNGIWTVVLKTASGVRWYIMDIPAIKQPIFEKEVGHPQEELDLSTFGYVLFQGAGKNPDPIALDWIKQQAA
ncbi:MAG: hypothetical protein EB060_01030 [Proteobacteria bacterium]|nr:hypothetical protein [Pseudomonadota bacterium]